MGEELFELSFSGTDAERAHHRARAEIARLPWSRGVPVRLSDAERAAARQQWTLAALQEYRSASVQAAILSALVAARVPLDLSSVVSRFPADELAHAEICARVAGVIGGGAPVLFDPEKVFSPPPPERHRPVANAAFLVAQHFGVGEGWSFGFLEQLRRATRVPLLRAVWGALLRDEAVHARFAWMFLGWAKGELTTAEWRELQRRVDASIASLKEGWDMCTRLAPASFSAISPLGPGDASQYLARARRAFDARVAKPRHAAGA